MTYNFTPRLMQARTAAVYLGVSQSTFLKYDLPRKRVGGNVLFDKNDLDSFADNQKYEGGSEEEDILSCDEAFGTIE